jgi:zinc protease
LFPADTAKPFPLIIEEKSGITQTYLSIGARTMCSSHHDVPTLDLISALLSGGTSSRLFIELREKHALTYDVNSDHNKGIDFGYFRINCAVKNKNLVKAKQVIFNELTKLRTEKVPTNELEKTKNLIVGASLRGMDDPQDCSEILAYMEMQYKSENALIDHVEKVKAVSSENILEAANTYLQEDRLATVILKPKETTQKEY